MARIIIAEDDEIIGEIVRDALMAAGHGAGLLPNGKDALNVIKSRRPDLVILDCNMPTSVASWFFEKCETRLISARFQF